MARTNAELCDILEKGLEMENLTAGIIDDTKVGHFYEAFVKCDGDTHNASHYAQAEFGLNMADTTEENDSWYEALARYRATFGGG